MLSKKCTKCEVEKAVSEFGKHDGMKDGLRAFCKKCRNKDAEAYQRTKAGLVTQIYGTQRATSKKRNHPFPSYTKRELKDWLYSQTLFHVLFDNWKKSGYETDLKPSCDRLDDYEPYTLNNVQLMIWRDNKEKGCQDRVNGVNNKQSKAVKQFDFDGNLVGEYYSMSQAERNTGVRQGNICNCCSGKNKTAGGYMWEYSEN